MILTTAGVVEPNNVEYSPAMVVREHEPTHVPSATVILSAPVPTASLHGRGHPTGLPRYVALAVRLVVVATVAIALQLAAEAIPTTLVSATVPITTDHAGRDNDAPAQGSMQTVLLPTTAPDASTGASLPGDATSALEYPARCSLR